MSNSYYKKIDGKRYDRKMLEIANKVPKSSKNNELGVDAAEQLFEAIVDGYQYTAVEQSTLKYIGQTYKFNPKAREALQHKIDIWEALSVQERKKIGPDDISLIEPTSDKQQKKLLIESTGKHVAITKEKIENLSVAKNQKQKNKKTMDNPLVKNHLIASANITKTTSVISQEKTLMTNEQFQGRFVERSEFIYLSSFGLIVLIILVAWWQRHTAGKK